MSICTNEFDSLGRMEARALRVSNLPMAIIPHPLGGLKTEEVLEKARIAFQEVARILDKGTKWKKL